MNYGWQDGSDDEKDEKDRKVQLQSVQEKESGRVQTNVIQRAVKSRSGHSIRSIQSNHSG